MNRGQVPRNRNNAETKIVVLCENCLQKLRIPKRNRKLRVTCPKCRYEFDFRYYALGFSSKTNKPLLVGLVGSLVGFFAVEIVERANILVPTSTPTLLLSSMLTIGVFGTCLGAVMGAADGFWRKNRGRLFYGMAIGAALGFISGVVSGLIAQCIYSAILNSVSPETGTSLAREIFARTIGWSVLGLLIGASYGIKENTTGDVKFGLIAGAIGGAIGGLLFDPLSTIVQYGDGTLGRLAGFLILGMAISVAISRLREFAISRNRPDMYRTLTKRLPNNPRLMLPPSTGSRSK